MSTNFYFHPFFRQGDRLELTLRILTCFVEFYAVDELTVHPPLELFRSPRLHRYPRTYHVDLDGGLMTDAAAIAQVDTALVGKRKGSPSEHASISPARLCAYVAHWGQPFGIDFAAVDGATGRFVANLSLRLNDGSNIYPEDAVCGPIIMGPSVRSIEDDLFVFLDIIAPVLAVDGLAFGIVAIEAPPRIDDAIALAASRERLRSLQIADEEVELLDETRSSPGLQLFLRPCGRLVRRRRAVTSPGCF